MESARLQLEPLVAAHADELFGGLTDARLYTYTPDQPPLTLEALRARFARLETRQPPPGDGDRSEQWLNWLVRERAGARPLGYVQATVYADGRAAIAYVLLHHAWGHGYAREATQRMIDHLRERGVRRFIATVDLRNAASVRLLEALGFTRRGGPAQDAEYERD
jgi:ribosomal-protein-alanine N-acetyltransferase